MSVTGQQGVYDQLAQMVNSQQPPVVPVAATPPPVGDAGRSPPVSVASPSASVGPTDYWLPFNDASKCSVRYDDFTGRLYLRRSELVDALQEGAQKHYDRQNSSGASSENSASGGSRLSGNGGATRITSCELSSGSL